MGLPGVKTDWTNLDPGEVCILIIKQLDITLCVLLWYPKNRISRAIMENRFA